MPLREASLYALRFMSGCREKLEGPLLDYAMRVYRGHRVVPVEIIEQLNSSYEKHLVIKAERKSDFQ